jgi:hypothetical protein
VGAGEDTAQILLKSVHKRNASQQKAWNDAAYAIGYIKRWMPGSVGGEPILLNLSAQGDIEVSGYADAKSLEKYTHAYDLASRALLSRVMDLEDDEGFEGQLKLFAERLPFMRKQWQDERHLRFSNAPPTASDIVIDLR